MDATRPRSAWPEIDDDLHVVLDGLRRDGVLALHGRTVPGRGSLIDHLAVGTNGVWVGSEHHVRGQVRLRTSRNLLGRIHLSVNGCDRTPWSWQLEDLVRHVRRALAEAELLHVSVHGALCFTGTELSFLQRQLPLDDGVATWPRALRKQLLTPGPVDDELRVHVHAVLDRSFPVRG